MLCIFYQFSKSM